MRKLVQLDPVTLRFTEVDTRKVVRAARAIQQFLAALPPERDHLDLRGKMGPVVEGVLSGRLKLPLDPNNKPLRYENTERLLPEDYEELHAKFWIAALGSHLEPPTIIERDGKKWAYLELED